MIPRWLQILVPIALGILGALIAAKVSDALAADISETYTCDFVRVTDGDTIAVSCPDWPKPFRKMALRVAGIDTPESTKRQAKCVKEQRLGLSVKARMKQAFEGADTVSFTWAGHDDKYGGRIDAHVQLPDGKDWASELIRYGLARPYDGGKKSNWCK